MTAKILKENRRIVSRTTVHHLTDELLNTPTHKASRVEFEKAIEVIMGDSFAPAEFPIDVAYEINEFSLVPLHMSCTRMNSRRMSSC